MSSASGELVWWWLWGPGGWPGAACGLRHRDVPIRVIDKLPAPTDESRAIVVHARSLEMLERIGAVDGVMASGIHATGMEFHAAGKVLGRIGHGR